MRLGRAHKRLMRLAMASHRDAVARLMGRVRDADYTAPHWRITTHSADRPIVWQTDVQWHGQTLAWVRTEVSGAGVETVEGATALGKKSGFL